MRRANRASRIGSNFSSSTDGRFRDHVVAALRKAFQQPVPLAPIEARPDGGTQYGTVLRRSILHNSEFEARRLRHERRIPRRIPDQLDLGVGDALDGAQLGLDLAGDDARHRAARRGQSHLDSNDAVVGDVDVVDQAEFIDTHRNLRIVDAAQHILHPLRQRAPGGGDIGATFRKPRHSAVLAHSVLTGAVARSSAATSVCHGRVAHLTRIGNSRTPSNTASLSSPDSAPAAAASSLAVMPTWKRSNMARSSASLLPLTASVIRDADAIEIAQPAPSKRTWATRPSSSARKTVTLSPQNGLLPSA